MESMSNAPYALPTARSGMRMGNQSAVDLMIHDGLWDPYGNSHMGDFGDMCAKEHDFEAFAQAKHGRESTVRTVFACTVNESDDGTVSFDVSGNGFLYNMVRIIAGTLMEVGRGKIAPEQIPLILESKDRKNAGPTLPPQGLRLEWIRYGDRPAEASSKKPGA